MSTRNRNARYKESIGIKYIIGAILGIMLGAGIEYERGGSEIQMARRLLGDAYGCGELAGMKASIKKLNPTVEQLPELPWCSDFRDMWERKP